MKISRKKFLTFLGSIPVLGALGMLYMRLAEPDWYEVTEKDIEIGRFASPLRILHLSDFHASESVSLASIEKAIDLSLELKAEVAFLTGDFITWQLTEESEYKRILQKLSSQVPTFACIGNHDGGKWAATSHGYSDFSKVRALLKESGIRLLFNETAKLDLKGKHFSLVGLGDYWSGDTKPSGVLFPTRSADEAVIVLSHNPDSKEGLKPYDWDLMCCGHTHGGQLVVPLLGLRPFLPVVEKSFPEGLLTWGKRHIHITRGIGNLHGMRFNCRPEISILNVT